MRVNEEIYLNIIRSKKQQQSHCRYPCDSMFFTFHAAKVQRIFGTAKFLAKKMYRSYHFDKERANLFCYIFCLSGRAVICIVYLADFWNVQIYLLHFMFIGEGSYLYRLLSRRYYRRIAHLRIGDGPLPIRSASSGVLFVGCCLSGVRTPAYCLLARSLSGVRTPAYCLLAADSICRNLKDLLPPTAPSSASSAPSSADSTDRALLPIRGCPQTTDFATTASAILDKVAPLTQHVLYYKKKQGNAIERTVTPSGITVLSKCTTP